jgi:hypothetical protein
MSDAMVATITLHDRASESLLRAGRREFFHVWKLHDVQPVTVDTGRERGEVPVSSLVSSFKIRRRHAKVVTAAHNETPKQMDALCLGHKCVDMSKIRSLCFYWLVRLKLVKYSKMIDQ